MAVTHDPALTPSERVRALRPSSTLSVSARVKAMIAEGRDIIAFGAGEPDFTTPEPIVQAAIEALRSGRTHYEPVPGAPMARSAIADKLQRENGIDCRPEHVVISAGAKHSLYLAFQCLLDPGRAQEVIVLTPGWVTYRAVIELAGGVVVEVPSTYETQYKITPAQLDAAITPKTAAVILNNPSNPCGTTYTPDEVRGLIEVIARHEHVVLVSDEIYEKLVFGDIVSLSPGSVDAIADRVITINGLSKAYAMTGWRIGYACAPGNDGAIAASMGKMQGQMTSCITSFCYPAIVEALTNGAAAVEQMRSTFAARAELIDGLVSRWPDVRCPRSTGAFYILPDIGDHFGRTTPEGRKIDSSVTFAESLLEEVGVAVVPGDDFGECARRHVRLSYATSDEQITEGCQRVERWLATLQ
jgi:aspartate/methionine/tyrosine aminotransferase